MRIQSVSAVSVVVKDLEASRRFFEEYLDLQPVPEKPGHYRADRTGPEIQLIEIAEARLDPDDPGYAGHHFRHIGFEVPSLDDMIERSQEYGVRVFQLDERGVETVITQRGQDLSAMAEEVIFVRDPDNNVWEFAERGRSTSILFEK